jgi:hypothetical protein
VRSFFGTTPRAKIDVKAFSTSFPTAPKDVNQFNAVDLWAYMYLKPDKARDKSKWD